MTALPSQIPADGYREHLGREAPDDANGIGVPTTRCLELVLVAAPPQPPEAVQLEPTSIDLSNTTPVRAVEVGCPYLSPEELKAHRAYNALHYAFLALDNEVTGRMRSGDLDGAQRIQRIVTETKKRMGLT